MSGKFIPWTSRRPAPRPLHFALGAPSSTPFPEKTVLGKNETRNESAQCFFAPRICGAVNWPTTFLICCCVVGDISPSKSSTGRPSRTTPVILALETPALSTMSARSANSRGGILPLEETTRPSRIRSTKRRPALFKPQNQRAPNTIKRSRRIFLMPVSYPRAANKYKVSSTSTDPIRAMRTNAPSCIQPSAGHHKMPPAKTQQTKTHACRKRSVHFSLRTSSVEPFFLR